MTRQRDDDGDFVQVMEMRPTGWFSSNLEILMDDDLVGTARARFWGGYDVALGGEELLLRRRSFFRGRYELSLPDSETVIGRARALGFWQRDHEIEIAGVSGRIVPVSYFSGRQNYVVGDEVRAFVRPRGMFARGFIVQAKVGVSQPEMLFAGLVVQMLHRQQQQAATS